MQDDSKRLRVHCATLALVLFSLVACSVRGAEAQGRRGRGEQSRSAAQEMARTRVGRRDGARGVGVGGLEPWRGREAPFVFALARRLLPPRPPSLSMQRGPPHRIRPTRESHRALQGLRRWEGGSGSRSGEARPKRRRKQAATPCHARTHQRLSTTTRHHFSLVTKQYQPSTKRTAENKTIPAISQTNSRNGSCLSRSLASHWSTVPLLRIDRIVGCFFFLKTVY
jgi:hypothetical protein